MTPSSMCQCMPVTVQLGKLIIQLYDPGVGVTVEARLNSSLRAGTSLITTVGFHPEEAAVQLVKLLTICQLPFN